MTNYKTESDMGNIKIFNDTMSCFFANGFGDATNEVKIISKKNHCNEDGEFLGHFTVKTEAYLSLYDCSDEAIYKFSKGRWFVFLKEPLKFVIAKCDDELNS